MTTYNKATLKTYFEQGDVPSGTDYGNLIDSQINIVETALQSMGGPLATTKLITPLVSAAAMTLSTILSANSIYVNNLVAASASFTNGSFTNGSFTNVSAASINVTGDVSAATGTVYASAIRSTNGVISSTGIVSAAGSAQATAAVLTNIINRGKGVVDGQTTGFTPLANRQGLTQYLFNEGISANLWPPTGGTINGLAVNAAFPLAASASYTIFAMTASAYGVK